MLRRRAGTRGTLAALLTMVAPVDPRLATPLVLPMPAAAIREGVLHEVGDTEWPSAGAVLPK